MVIVFVFFQLLLILFGVVVGGLSELLGIFLTLIACFWSLGILYWIVSLAFSDNDAISHLKDATVRKKRTNWIFFAGLIKLPLTLLFLGLGFWLNRTHPLPLVFEMLLVYFVAVLGLASKRENCP